MTPRRGLGRGLDALLSPSARPAPQDDGRDEPLLLDIPLEAIAPNPEQPRADFDEAALDELADSIRAHGVLQPIVVERDGHGGYRLVAGERRVRAARRAGTASIAAIVRPATESSRHALELALIENLQRADLGPLEEAAAFQRLADTFGMTHEAIGLRVGRSRAAVANTVRLLHLPPSVQAAVRERRLSAGHGRALLALPSAAAQDELAAHAEREGWSVRATEQAVQQRLDGGAAPTVASMPPPTSPPGPRPATAHAATADDAALVRGLEEALGTPVRLERRRRGGRLVIDFFDDDQLDTLYSRLGGAQL